ncbi:DUF5681 domain-containing protein [Sphingorhabdus sp. Alg231-15]|uniref:DUF5681 domain-containing protein n=1 Tax=Sphingorhabdus sp. Alg231-15 TaxID=1922222 RepID=UPI000D54B0BB
MSKDDYDIGFGRPPHYTQFRKGQSGNPAGRPKKAQPPAEPIAGEEIDKILRAQLDREIALKGPGGAKNMKVLEAVLLAQQKSALAGNSAAQREVLKHARLLEQRELLRELHERERQEEDFKAALRWKEEQERIWAKAKDGCEPDDPWPHPDDFILDHHRRTWTIRGPVDPSDVARYRRIRYQRDYRLYALVEEIRRGDDPLVLAAHLTWVIFNNMLPRRWQIEKDDMDRVFVELLAVPVHRLRVRAETAMRQAELLPEPHLDKKARRKTYQIVNKAMQPLLKMKGFRSVAELEHHVSQNGE